jgi:serine/threonine-protein kinase
LKFLTLEQAEQATSAARFVNEGRSLAKLTSEHVARVTDVGMTTTGLPYIAMEYLEGQDLEQLLAQRGPLPVERAVDYVMQALEAMAEAHANNIVHRDLKPSNLFVVRRPDGKRVVKIIDFGIAKSIGDSEQTALTKQHSIVGSPAYMSPEQARGAPDIDARTDIWSIGVVLYELLSGRCPFHGKTFLEVLEKVTKQEPAPIASVYTGIAPALAGAVTKCLQRDRNQRFRSVADLADALVDFGSERARASHESIVGLVRGSNAFSTPPEIPIEIEAVGGDATWDRARLDADTEPAPADAPATLTRAETPPSRGPTPADKLAPRPQGNQRRGPVIEFAAGVIPSLVDNDMVTSERTWLHAPLRISIANARRVSIAASKRKQVRWVLFALALLASVVIAFLLWQRARGR